MKYTPLEDRILVRPIKKTELETTDNGIIIPDSVKKEVAEGIVVAAGQGRYAPENGVAIPCIVAKGDMVLYGANQGLEIEIDGEAGKETVRILRESDILLVVETQKNGVDSN